MKTMIAISVIAAAAACASAGDVNPGIIFGSGNANGGFTIGTGSGIELGLRGKVRYDINGQPQNQYNYDGVNTYTFNPANSNAPAGRSIFNFEWSVNSDVNHNPNDTAADTLPTSLNTFLYEIAIYKDGTDPLLAARADLINDPAAMLAIDHSFGNNATTNLTDTVGNVGNYGGLIGSANVAQNSSNFGFLTSFFAGTSMEGWDQSEVGTWIITLSAFENLQGQRGEQLASSSINVVVVPLPPAAWAGLAMLGGIVGVRKLRRR